MYKYSGILIDLNALLLQYYYKIICNREDKTGSTHKTHSSQPDNHATPGHL